jgi:hypothetical protein
VNIGLSALSVQPGLGQPGRTEALPVKPTLYNIPRVPSQETIRKRICTNRKRIVGPEWKKSVLTESESVCPTSHRPTKSYVECLYQALSGSANLC